MTLIEPQKPCARIEGTCAQLHRRINGEYDRGAKCRSCAAACRSFAGVDWREGVCPALNSKGTEHAVEVEAESLYDAVGVAIARFHDAPSAMLSASRRGRFTVEVRQPTTTHTVEYAAFARWMNEPFGSPPELAVRAKLKELVKHRPIVPGTG